MVHHVARPTCIRPLGTMDVGNRSNCSNDHAFSNTFREELRDYNMHPPHTRIESSVKLALP